MERELKKIKKLSKQAEIACTGDGYELSPAARKAHKKIRKLANKLLNRLYEGEIEEVY